MKKTPSKYRNLIVYQVFVRNHTPEGTFRALMGDLDRIRSLGVDILYLLPIHPIGVANRKGSLGSPYSIRDYRQINPELGTMADFQDFITAVHSRGMKLMMDVVFNHTSRDSELLHAHPEWFYRDSLGKITNRVGDWWDVTDFDFTLDKALWKELADILTGYATMGVDGFRCDVANLVPLRFWSLARKAVSRINPDIVWLSESVHGGFVKYIRDRGFDASSEGEMFSVFDMAYEYDLQPYYDDYLKRKRPLRDYLEALARQEEIYPADYVKMSNLENHDFDRIASYVQGNPGKIHNWTAFAFFQKAAVMLYAGQEYSSDRKPDLFEKDPVVRREDISPLIRRLVEIKKRRVFADGIWKVNIPEIDGVAYNTVENSSEKWVGIFNVGQMEGDLPVNLPDGTHRNRISGLPVRIRNGKVALSPDPIILRLRK